MFSRYEAVSTPFYKCVIGHGELTNTYSGAMIPQSSTASGLGWKSAASKSVTPNVEPSLAILVPVTSRIRCSFPSIIIL